MSNKYVVQLVITTPVKATKKQIKDLVEQTLARPRMGEVALIEKVTVRSVDID